MSLIEVVAIGSDHGGIRIGRETICEFFEGDAADSYSAAKIGVVADVGSGLREFEKRVARKETHRAGRKIEKIAGDFEVRGRRAGSKQKGGEIDQWRRGRWRDGLFPEDHEADDRKKKEADKEEDVAGGKHGTC